jgi:hypothetical protein
MEAKKSPIFLLPLLKNHVRKDNEGSKAKPGINASKNLRFFDALIPGFAFEPSLSFFLKNLG